MDLRNKSYKNLSQIPFLGQLSMAETLYCPQIQIASEKPIFLHGFCK